MLKVNESHLTCNLKPVFLRYWGDDLSIRVKGEAGELMGEQKASLRGYHYEIQYAWDNPPRYAHHTHIYLTEKLWPGESMLIQFSGTQWSAIANSFELIALTLLATAIYGFVTQSRVLFKYRNIMALASVMCLIDFISYAKLLLSFVSASDGNNVLFGAGNSTFDFSVRYVAWVICVPLQVAILIKLVAPDKRIATSLNKKSIPAVVIMMLLGYLGELNSQFIIILGLFSAIVFLYVLWSIFSPFKTLLTQLSTEVRHQFIRLRLLMVSLWCIYPILYFLNCSNELYLESPNFLVAQQLILVVADLLSKAYFSLEVFKIARMKSNEEGFPNHE